MALCKSVGKVHDKLIFPIFRVLTSKLISHDIKLIHIKVRARESGNLGRHHDTLTGPSRKEADNLQRDHGVLAFRRDTVSNHLEKLWIGLLHQLNINLTGQPSFLVTDTKVLDEPFIIYRSITLKVCHLGLLVSQIILVGLIAGNTVLSFFFGFLELSGVHENIAFCILEPDM